MAGESSLFKKKMRKSDLEKKKKKRKRKKKRKKKKGNAATLYIFVIVNTWNILEKKMNGSSPTRAHATGSPRPLTSVSFWSR